jgi:hypothetical protein
LPLLLVDIIKDYFIRVGDVLVARLDMCFKMKVTRSMQGLHEVRSIKSKEPIAIEQY